MGYVQRELDRIRLAILDPANAECAAELHAAQQALSWLGRANQTRSPYAAITGALIQCKKVVGLNPVQNSVFRYSCP